MRQFTFAVAVCLSAITLHAGDWTGFRGPTGQGLAGEKNLPVEWDADKNVVWKTPIPGLGWSSPIILGGRIFLDSPELWQQFNADGFATAPVEAASTTVSPALGSPMSRRPT